MSDFTSFHTTLGGDGRVVIPAPVRKELGLHSWRRSRRRVRCRAEPVSTQRRRPGTRRGPGLSSVCRLGTSPVDELIADRRAEAARENAATDQWLAARKP